MTGNTSQPPQDLGTAIAALQQQQKEREEQEEATKIRDLLVHVQSAAMDKGAAYTNLITLGGYAGAFTLWSFTKEHLPMKATILVALLLGVSLTIFIFHEVFKMVHSVRAALRTRALLVEHLPANEFLRRFEEQRSADDRDGLKWMMPVWIAQLFFTVATGLAALGILFYNFIAILLALPPWPGP